MAEVGPKSPFYIFMVQAKYLVSWPRVIVAALHSFAVTSYFYGPNTAAFLVMAVLLLSHLIGLQGDYLLGETSVLNGMHWQSSCFFSWRFSHQAIQIIP